MIAIAAARIAADGIMGLKENGVVDELRKMIIDGKLRAPANLGDLDAFTPPALP